MENAYIALYIALYIHKTFTWNVGNVYIYTVNVTVLIRGISSNGRALA